MTRFRITVKNYRAFSDENPAVFEIGSGTIAFVGPNNSGKSSLLKLFYELRPLFGYISGTSNIQNFLEGRVQGFAPVGVEDPLEMYHNGNTRPLSVAIGVEPPSYDSVSEWQFTSLRTQPTNWTAEVFAVVDGGRRRIERHAGGNVFHLVDLAKTVPLDAPELTDLADLVGRSLYIGPYRNAISESSGFYYDLAIGTNFISQWNEWKTGGARVANVDAQRVTDDIAKIFEYERLEINSANGNKTLQIIADGRPYRLRELGAGIAQFIIVLGNAITKKPRLILIDEPELNLHPSLQIDFLLSLGSYATDCVAFSTHSIGLARSTADVLYSCRRKEGHAIVRPFEQTLGLTEFLGEMSFTSFKDLGHDTVLLVEGVSEVKAVQQFLRQFGRDHEIVVLPMGGDQFIRGGRTGELAELQRLTNNVAVLIDSERKTAADALAPHRAEFLSDCQRLGFIVHATELRAFENYLTQRAVEVVYGSEKRALTPFERLGAKGIDWPKSEIWRIARAMTKAEIVGSDLGQFLAALP